MVGEQSAISAIERADEGTAMKWVSVRTECKERLGLVIDSQIHLLGKETRLIDLLGDDGEKMAAAAESVRRTPADVLDFHGADLAPPLRPNQIRDTLLFLQHMQNCRPGQPLEEEWHQIPAFYFGNTTAAVGPYDPVEIFPGSIMFDFELEVASIVGKAGANIHPDDADDYIAGFMIFNDWSARDLQRLEGVLRIGQAKGKDGANTFGPMFVTKDELEPYRSGHSYHLKAQAFVNDTLIGEGYLDQMNWSFGEVIAYASRGTEVLPGDAICSGTVPTCCLIEHFMLSLAEGEDGTHTFPGWLKAGDTVRLEVEELGVTRQILEPSVPVHKLRTEVPN